MVPASSYIRQVVGQRRFDHWDYGIGIMERRVLGRLVGIIARPVPMTRVRE
jgi:hypothetical protein